MPATPPETGPARRALILADFTAIHRPGGLGRVAWESARALTTMGHDAVVVEPRRRCLSTPQRIDGVTVFRSPDPPRLSPGDFLRPPRAVLRHVMERFRPDGIVVHGPLSSWVMGRCRERLSGVPAVLVFHSPWGDEYRVEHGGLRGFFGGRLRDAMERRAVKEFDAHVTLSRYMAEQLAERHGIGVDRIWVLPGGVDLERFSPPRERTAVRRRLGWPLHAPVLVTVRNLRPRMGLETLLDAVSSAREQLPELRLVVAGEGPLRGALRDHIQQLGLADSVEMVGFVEESRLPDFYRGADLAVVPTRALEGFGLTLLEALACGTPVVATPVGGMPEVLVPLDPGLLSSDTSADALAVCLLSWLTDEDRRVEIGRRGRRYVEERFTWPSFAEGLLETLDGARPAG